MGTGSLADAKCLQKDNANTPHTLQARPLEDACLRNPRRLAARRNRQHLPPGRTPVLAI